jgi:hypothetical protein
VQVELPSRRCTDSTTTMNAPTQKGAQTQVQTTRTSRPLGRPTRDRTAVCRYTAVSSSSILFFKTILRSTFRWTSAVTQPPRSSKVWKIDLSCFQLLIYHLNCLPYFRRDRKTKGDDRRLDPDKVDLWNQFFQS